MRTIILVFTALLSCGTPAPATEPKYSTHFLLNWTYNCSRALQPELLMKGVPMQYALENSIRVCSCVIDKYRRDFTAVQLGQLTAAEKLAYSTTYAEECTGQWEPL